MAKNSKQDQAVESNAVPAAVNPQAQTETPETEVTATAAPVQPEGYAKENPKYPWTPSQVEWYRKAVNRQRERLAGMEQNLAFMEHTVKSRAANRDSVKLQKELAKAEAKMATLRQELEAAQAAAAAKAAELAATPATPAVAPAQS